MLFSNKLYLLAFILIFSSARAQKEERHFRAVFSAGVVGSQVDGDTYGGYNKAGLMAGVFVNRPISEKIELELGLSYIQKGARKNANPAKGDYNSYLLRLNYVEIPVIVKYTYKKFKPEIGIAYARLFKYSEQNSAVGYYNNNNLLNRDISYYWGCGFVLSENLLAKFQYGYSMVPIRPYNAQGVYLGTFWTRIFNKGLYNHLIALSLNYTLNPAKSE